MQDKDFSAKPSVRHRKVKSPFVGSTVFFKKAGPGVSPEVAEPPVIVPNTLESLSMQLSVLSREMAVAQAKDPALNYVLR